MDWPNHTAAWREWRDASAGARMHHGWILAGKAGLGKHDFALQAARELVSEEGVPQPSGEHPDIHVLTYGPKDDKAARAAADGKDYERARSIRIGQIRGMQQRLNTRPSVGSRRVIIINPADDMERPASNALLKSLEEPPQGTFFLLVTHRPSGLLPTIRSRCRILRFPDLDNETIAQHLGAGSSAAIELAGGSLGAARKFMEMKLEPIAQVMQQLAVQGDPAMVLRAQLIAEIGARPSRERLHAVLELARTTLAQSVAEAPAEKRLGIIEAHSALVDLA
ncbi:MAG: DNA polymerase III subunit delta', partial [Altererythrobacter sp.]|nr:DNA polymerase III subunit delta' [Altererythrobacter sp.]